HRRAGCPSRCDAARQAGLLRPDIALNVFLLVLYAAAGVVYAIHFARRQPAVGRAATTMLLFAALVHTFVIGMQTMEVGHVPFANASSAISTFVWLLTLSYLYLALRLGAAPLLAVSRAAHRRAGDGRLHPADRRVPADHPDVEARSRDPQPRARQPVVLGPHRLVAVRLCQLRAGGCPWTHVYAAIQGDQEEAPRLSLHAAAVVADSRQHEQPGGHGRMAVPHRWRRGRRHLGNSAAGGC